MSSALSVLLAEDDPSAIRLFLRKVQNAPLEISVKDVRQREAFIRELESNPYDCVVIDFTLPDMDGIEALRLVKDLAPETPTIVYTGTVGEEKAAECMKEGAAEFLLKTNSMRLVPAIQAIVTQKREREARLKAEAAQKQSEALFHILTEMSSAAIFIYSGDQFIYINTVTEILTGYTHNELMSMSVWDLVHPEHREFMQNRALARQRGEDVPNRYEIKVVTKSGKFLWADFAASSIVYNNQQAILGIAFDVSERKAQEEALRASEENYRSLFESARDVIFLFTPEGMITALNPAFETATDWKREEWVGKSILEMLHPDDVPHAQLRLNQINTEELLHPRVYRVRKRNGEYVYAEIVVTTQMKDGAIIGLIGTGRDVSHQKKLEEQFRHAQKMESVGTLAGGVAHDFNNILGIISGYAGLAVRHMNDVMKLKHDIDMISQASSRGAAVVQQLLTFAKRSAVFHEPVNVNDVVQELLPMLEATFPKTIEIQLNLEKQLQPMNADKNQIHQSLLNMALNARDAMPDGGVLRFSTEMVAGECVKATEPDAKAREYIHLSISDTGCGMSEDVKSKIFDPFFTTKPKGKGTGLGLSVVYGVVGSHDGFIHVESMADHGTEFHIYLPVSLSVASVSKIAADVTEMKGGTETILIVEDEQPLREFLRTLLEEKGYAVIEAANGLEAIDVLETNTSQIDLVLSDMGMPKLNGMGLLKKVIESRPSMKVLMASGFVDPDLRSEILRFGARDIIQKPYDGKEILLRLREILDLAK